MFREAFNRVQDTGSNRDFGTTQAAKCISDFEPLTRLQFSGYTGYIALVSLMNFSQKPAAILQPAFIIVKRKKMCYNGPNKHHKGGYIK